MWYEMQFQWLQIIKNNTNERTIINNVPERIFIPNPCYYVGAVPVVIVSDYTVYAKLGYQIW